ncbi:tetratricopeptide repeat protein [Phenylobacterium sp.]|uniref:tetratricopeptide repeat protein n=1 Tax=Phenylobacterium sp. TaxID=1871053 RepID=UPI0025E6F128|nr:tetratricopeptide repeat protein [Phenylobacterium sp.]
MTDLFEEVEEQLRSDRYRQFARTLLPWLLGLAAIALIVTLGYWGYDTWRTRQTDAASEQYAEAMDAMGKGDADKARTLWTTVSKSQAGGYKALSLMHLAAFAADKKNTAEAVKLLDEAAAAAPDPIIGDAARLKSAFALLDTAPLSELEGRLKPLMEEGHPYKAQAREALAFAKLNAGDLKGARGDFVLLSQSLDAGQGAQARAQAAIGLIDAGSAKAVPTVVRAAALLPPPMPIDPSLLMPPGPQGQPQENAPQ